MKINTINSLKIILISLLIGVSGMFIFRPDGISLLKIFLVLFIIIPVTLSIYFFIKNLYYFKYIHPYFSFTFFALIFWIIFTIVRSIDTNISDMITLFSHFRVGGIVWLTPLIIIYGFNINIWKPLLNLIPNILIVGILFFLIASITTNISFSAVKYFLLFFIFASFLSFFYNSRNRILILISSIFYILVSINISQRANFVFLLVVISFLTLLFLVNKYRSNIKKIFITLLILLTTLFLSLKIPEYYNKMTLDRETTQDTRTFLFKELINDLDETEIVIGKGALGTYYSPYFRMSTKYSRTNKVKNGSGDSAVRTTSEVGYLFMLLKGGIIMIILHLLILLPTIFIGFFKTKNIFTKGLSLYIFSYLIMWTVSYTPEYLPEFFLLWIAVGGCISEELRNKTDEELFKLLNTKE